MIGYVTLGASEIVRARAFYDDLLGLIGAKRIMEFGDELGGFTMWGSSWDKPGLAVTLPYDKQANHPGNGTMTALTVDQRALVDALHAKALELGGTVKARRDCAGMRGRRLSMAPISVTLTGTSCARSGLVRSDVTRCGRLQTAP